MAWLQIIIALISLLLNLFGWLKKREDLTDRQRKKINGLIFRMRQVEAEAVRLGCKPGGEE